MILRVFCELRQRRGDSTFDFDLASDSPLTSPGFSIRHNRPGVRVTRESLRADVVAATGWHGDHIVVEFGERVETEVFSPPSD